MYHPHMPAFLALHMCVLSPAGGNDISKGMRPIYGIMGLCPQHDLLWGILTGREHLRFYGTLKGMSGASLDKRPRNISGIVYHPVTFLSFVHTFMVPCTTATLFRYRTVLGPVDQLSCDCTCSKVRHVQWLLVYGMCDDDC
jgi:hypothetical protein